MSTASKVAAIVSTKWVAEHLTRANIRILDGSWHLPNQNRDPEAEYLQAHIPGSLFFDIEKCSTPSDYNIPHMLPQPKQFEQYVGEELGICNDTHVIVYDNNELFGLLSAQRVWWTFRVFGHNRVSVVDGGLPKWLKENQPVTKEIPKVIPQTFKAHFQAHLVKSFEDMKQSVATNDRQIVDARPSGRFQGKAPEPRDGKRTASI
jgi:thiosulfate/3-mercaptopyruvate sulfurtransferase